MVVPACQVRGPTISLRGENQCTYFNVIIVIVIVVILLLLLLLLLLFILIILTADIFHMLLLVCNVCHLTRARSSALHGCFIFVLVLIIAIDFWLLIAFIVGADLGCGIEVVLLLVREVLI